MQRHDVLSRARQNMPCFNLQASPKLGSLVASHLFGVREQGSLSSGFWDFDALGDVWEREIPCHAEPSVRSKKIGGSSRKESRTGASADAEYVGLFVSM